MIFSPTSTVYYRVRGYFDWGPWELWSPDARVIVFAHQEFQVMEVRR